MLSGVFLTSYLSFLNHIHKPLSFEHVFRPSFCLCRKNSAEILMFSPVVPSISLSSTSVLISSPNLNFPRFRSVQLQSTSAHPTSISLGFTQFNFSPHQLTPPQFPSIYRRQFSFSPHQLTKPQFPSVSLSSTSVHISSPDLNIAVDLIQFNSIVASMELTGLEILACCLYKPIQFHNA